MRAGRKPLNPNYLNISSWVPSVKGGRSVGGVCVGGVNACLCCVSLQAEPIRVVVTGAAGQIAYSLLYSIAKGDVFGKEQVRSCTPAPGWCERAR